jgi:Tol biopolymer transport system component
MCRMKSVRRLTWLLTKAKRHALAIAVGSILFAVPALFASPIQSASVRGANLPSPAGGNGDSVAPAMSADGRFVLFSSSANNLVPGDNSQLGFDVFLRDRSSNTTVLVSANFTGTGGGNGNSICGQVSTNGRYAVFQSDSSDLLPGDTNGISDIFVRDVQGGSNILVSVAPDGSWGNGASTDPVMTPDGRYVAFVSAATNLVAGDTNGIPDVFVRDLLNGSTRLVSADATGAGTGASSPVITPDGRYVAFFSTSQGLAPGVSASTSGEVYVRDLVANTTTWSSTNAANIVSTILHLNSAPSFHPAISVDGRFVSFKSGWTNAATAPDSPGVAATIIFQYNSTNGATTIVSSNGFPTWLQNDDVYGPEMSPDGRFIVFVATNGSSACLTVQLWDAQAETNLNVSVATDGSLPTSSISDTPAVSADGRYVVFMSNATNLTSNAVTNGFHLYCRDTQAGTTQLVDVDTNGMGSANLVTTIPAISADGRFVAFDSLDGGLVSGDNNEAFDVFVRDLNGGATELISQSAPGLIPQTGDGLSSLAQYALSDDGRKIVFTSSADDLVPNDFNGTSDVFAFDLAAGTNMLVSAGVDGNAAAGSSFYPALSSGGRFVAFISTATNLVAGQMNQSVNFVNVFLRDLQAGTNALVSVAPDGITPGNGDAAMPAISQDGRYVVFLSRASNLASGASASTANTYLRDLVSGTNTLLINNSSTTLTPSISADGRYVAYFGSSSQLTVRDTQLGTTVYTTTATGSAVVSPSGARLLYNNGTSLSAINLLNKSVLFRTTANVPIRNRAPWSSDGRFFTFVTTVGAVPIDTNGINDVYLYDLLTNSLTLVSVNAAHTAAANGASDWPAVSGDGHFVIYRSFATDIVAGNTNPPPNIFLFDRFTGSNSLLTAASPGSTWSSWNAKPMINGDGRVVAFQSWNPGMAANDLNRAQDVIAGMLQPWGAVDSDGDGVPDLWMMHYFGHPTGQAGDLSLAQNDADGDGMSNLQEFLAGTDPTDPASVLRLQIGVQISSPNNVMLNWPAVPGKNYRVQFKDNLNDAVWSEAPGATVVGLQGSFSIPAGQSSRFYRVTTN